MGEVSYSIVRQHNFEAFKAQHQKFLAFIKGIPSLEHREWYTSVMLSRLMLAYFIQKKGFLDGDEEYLPNHLERIRLLKGNDSFYSFYRTFLLRLFHERLGGSERPTDLDREFGYVPYLNGGLFEKHRLEEVYPDIEIPDEAFDGIFQFFSQWRWHLDDAGKGNDNEINPDVFGYIFEKFANQKEMGAYYTRDDVTEYIARNTIIPYLFDAVQKNYPHPFQTDLSLWRLLQHNPDRYIYEVMKKGAQKPLPEEIASGLQNAARRHTWNRLAPQEDALPSETWREAIIRRQRYQEIRRKLAEGTVTSINDFITYNLDICTFARDVIMQTQDIELIRHFYTALLQMTVLDPTCGSGAFLLAAINILKPLHENCLKRMEEMVAKHDDLNGDGKTEGDDLWSATIRYFREVLYEIEQHPNRNFFVLKSIIVNNLYGVDIKQEVVEICRLCLFLKLLAQIDTIEELELLPDVDFNIYSGDSLIGFASYDEIKRAIGNARKRMDFDNVMGRIEDALANADQMLRNVQDLQAHNALSSPQKMLAKARLDKALSEVGTELDTFMAAEYRIKSDSQEYLRWEQSYRPFHWLVKFYGVMRKGGFDVIIGNPPYIENKSARTAYSHMRYATLPTGNLYALTMERCASLLAPISRFGMIVPSSATCAGGYWPLQKLLLAQGTLHISSYSDQRGKLFDTAHPRLCIILSQKQAAPDRVFSTSYLKLDRELRDSLFQRLSYIDVTHQVRTGIVPRYSSSVEWSLCAKLYSQSNRLGDYLSKTGDHKLYYTRKISWFVQVTPFIPTIINQHGWKRDPSELKTLSFASAAQADIAFVALNSSLFYWFITTGSDCRNLNMREVLGLPLSIHQIADTLQHTLCELAVELAADLQSHSELRNMTFKNTGPLVIQCLFPGRSRATIDEIDCALAHHYGFTGEELDFIINYDVKYRWGTDAGESQRTYSRVIGR